MEVLAILALLLVSPALQETAAGGEEDLLQAIENLGELPLERLWPQVHEIREKWRKGDVAALKALAARLPHLQVQLRKPLWQQPTLMQMIIRNRRRLLWTRGRLY